MKTRPASVFFAAAILILCFGLLSKDKNVEIGFHDSYLLIACLHATVLFSVFAGLISLVYLGYEKT